LLIIAADGQQVYASVLAAAGRPLVALARCPGSTRQKVQSPTEGDGRSDQGDRHRLPWSKMHGGYLPHPAVAKLSRLSTIGMLHKRVAVVAVFDRV
jgi:hypothetical protein